MIFVSVVITTKNEEKNIGNCLESIRRQTYSQNLLEVIVVDNNSTDQTKQIAKGYKVKVFNKGPERSAQRNYGIEKSEGEYFIYLDADMILSSTVIEKAVEKLSPISNIQYLISGAPTIALYIPEIILGNSYWNRVRRFERSFYDGTAIDCVRVIRKDIFEKVGGFDTNMTGPEDWDLDKKVRGKGKVEVLDTYDFEEINEKLAKITHDRTRNLVETLSGSSLKTVVYHNEAKFNIQKYFQKKSYYAKSFSTYINKWGKNDPDIKRQFGFWYRYFGVFLEKGKWKKLIKFPFLVFGMYFLRFLVGMSFVFSRIR